MKATTIIQIQNSIKKNNHEKKGFKIPEIFYANHNN